MKKVTKDKQITNINPSENIKPKESKVQVIIHFSQYIRDFKMIEKKYNFLYMGWVRKKQKAIKGDMIFLFYHFNLSTVGNSIFIIEH